MAPTPQGATTAEKTKSIKPKSKAAMKPESTVKNEKVAPTTVKREHLDDEGTAAAPVAKKQKMKKLKVTTIIDLTSDDEKDAIMVE